MIECSEHLLDYLHAHDYSLLMRVKSKGCSGYSVETEVVYSLYKGISDYNMYDLGIYIDDDLWDMVVEGDLELFVDYLDKELIQGVHVSVKNKDMCGCGKSFNVTV